MVPARGRYGLAELGRPVKIMTGGITGWIDEGFDLEAYKKARPPRNPGPRMDQNLLPVMEWDLSFGSMAQLERSRSAKRAIVCSRGERAGSNSGPNN